MKISIIQRFILFVAFVGKKTTKTRPKNARNLKRIQVRSDDDIEMKFDKMHKFRSLGLELQASSLGVFDEVSAELCERLLSPPKKSRWGSLISASISADACFFEPVAN